MDDLVNTLRAGWRLRRGVAALGRVLFPPRCLVCQEPGMVDVGLDLCEACAAALPWLEVACPLCGLPLPAIAGQRTTPCGSCQQNSPPVDGVHAAFVYRWPVDLLLRRFKFHGDLSAGRLLASLMTRRFADGDVGVLVPVPLHRKRLGQRGYDQVGELVRLLSRGMDVRAAHLLERVRATAPQSELDATARRRNLRGAFRPTSRLPAHVTLVDDVMTTGATIYAAATALRRAGVSRVDALVCARVP